VGIIKNGVGRVKCKSSLFTQMKMPIQKDKYMRIQEAKVALSASEIANIDKNALKMLIT